MYRQCRLHLRQEDLVYRLRRLHLRQEDPVYRLYRLQFPPSPAWSCYIGVADSIGCSAVTIPGDGMEKNGRYSDNSESNFS